MKRFHVRPMRREDIPAVAELEKICFSEPWSAALLSDSLHRQEYTFLVAVEETDDTRVAGYIGARTVLDEMDVANVAVFPEYRQQGVASAMLDHLLQTARERDLYGVTLEVRVGNAPAIFLYETKGFVREGIRPKFYSGPTEDALIMWKYLKKEPETK